jgi:hypothetical protein
MSRSTPRSPALAPRTAVARSRVSNNADLLAGIDGRSGIARRYRDILAQVAVDQGGVDRMSEVRLQLCRRFASLCVVAEGLESRLANGEACDVGEHAIISSTLCRLSSRIGLGRAAKIVPSLADYIEGRAIADEDAA